ncbi:hypothetical protein Droror1_Dr00020680 [Drosera rotundifolia]
MSMSKPPFLLLFSFITTLILLFPISFAQRLNYTQFSCADDSATNSTGIAATALRPELGVLVSVLMSNASAAGSGFWNGSVGGEYGIAMCRGDVGELDCRECLRIAGIQIQQNCPGQQEAITWDEWCMLHYSNKYIFSTLQYEPHRLMQNANNITSADRSRWDQILGKTISDIISRAASGSTGKKYSTKEATFTDFNTLYSMAQCTPDLTASQCTTCFEVAKGYLPIGRIGGIVLTPSCSLRYELYPFYANFSVAQEPASDFPLLFPPPASDHKKDSGGKGKGTNTRVIGIAAGVAAFVLLIAIVIFCIMTSKKGKTNKKYNELAAPNGDMEFTTIDSLQYDFGTLQAATNNFSDENKIGEGGFGSVYKIS